LPNSLSLVLSSLSSEDEVLLLEVLPEDVEDLALAYK
jgi:hypothetical protein